MQIPYTTLPFQANSNKMLYSIKSVGELPFVQGNSKFAYISATAFEKFFGDFGDNNADQPAIMALKLTTIPGDIVRYVAVAGAADDIDDHDIYLPYSIYQELTATSRFPPKVTATVAYELERATKIVLKPLDNAIYHSEMRDLLEEEMMDFPLLQKHTQFTIHLRKLGDYPVDIWVEDIEPAEVVRLGGEVVVDFSEPLEEFVAEPPVAAVRAPTPIPPPIDEPVVTGPFTGMSFSLDNAFVPADPQPKPVIPTLDQAAQIRAARIARFNNSAAAPSSQAI